MHGFSNPATYLRNVMGSLCIVIPCFCWEHQTQFGSLTKNLNLSATVALKLLEQLEIKVFRN